MSNHNLDIPESRKSVSSSGKLYYDPIMGLENDIKAPLIQHQTVESNALLTD